MTPEQFCYWLQGFAELNPEGTPTGEQWDMIREHLGTVFNKVTPPLKKVLNEKKASTIEEAIRDMQVNRPGVYCDPYSMPGKIC